MLKENEKRFKIEKVTYYNEQMSLLEKRKVMSAFSSAAFAGAALLQLATLGLYPDIMRFFWRLSALGFATMSVLQFKILLMTIDQKKMLLEGNVNQNLGIDQKNQSKVLKQ